ncbi:putative transposase [Mycobacterium xenopi 3993]|nr:putative transposase [Mycobacterium xenopi 3993]
MAAVLGTARRLGIEELIDPTPSRRRDLVVARLVAQVIDPAPSWHSRAGCAPRPPPVPSVRCSGCRAVTRMTCMPRWTGRWPARTGSKTLWPHGI